MNPPSGVAEFWELTTRRASQLKNAQSAEDPVYAELISCLHEIHPDLYIHFQTDGGDFVISADGDRELFALVRVIVDAAPSIPGWNVQALKPKLGLPVQTQWEGVTVRAADAYFMPLSRPDSDSLGLRIHVKGLHPDDQEAATDALYRMLDNALGEERFACSVAHLEVLPWSDSPAARLYPLETLDEFISHRERRLAGQPR